MTILLVAGPTATGEHQSEPQAVPSVVPLQVIDDLPPKREPPKVQKPPNRRVSVVTTRVKAARVIPSAPAEVESIIRQVFGMYGDQALQVAWCESRYRTDAKNGQYLGLFQMGSDERAKWGHGPDAHTQVVSAYAYFAATGFDWSPWDPKCRP